MTPEEARAEAERIASKQADVEPAEREEIASRIAARLVGNPAPPPRVPRGNSPEELADQETEAALRQEQLELAKAHAADQAPAAEKPSATAPAAPKLEVLRPTPKPRALDDQTVGATALLVYMILSVVADAEGRYQGGQAELAHLARCSEPELLEALRKLEAAGHVHRQVVPVLQVVR